MIVSTKFKEPKKGIRKMKPERDTEHSKRKKDYTKNRKVKRDEGWDS